MQQWRADHFPLLERSKTLLSNGKTIEDFKNFNDRNLSTKEFTNLLFYTLHPFEAKKYVKILSPLQKAITMVIYMHGGYTSESEIISFLSRHWTEITSVSKQAFVRKPDLRLLHMNTAVRKNGHLIFVKKPDDPFLIGVNNTNINDSNEYASDDSNQEEMKPMKSRERSKRSNNDTDNFVEDLNNSDADGKDDEDDIDSKGSSFHRRIKRGRRFGVKPKSDESASFSNISIRETRSKKDKRSNYPSNYDDKEKLSQENNTNNEYSLIATRSVDHHYGSGSGRGPRRFTIEPIHQTPSLSSATPVKSTSNAINIMKINSTLLLPPIQKDPAPSYSLLTSSQLPGQIDEDAAEHESKDLGTGLSVNWRWCNFSMTTAERILFFPLSKPLDSSADSIQSDPRFDFEIPDHLSFEEIIIFVINETCSRAFSYYSSVDAAFCGITVDQIIEKVKDFKDKEGMYLSLPLNERIRAILFEAKELKLVGRDFFNQKEIWYPLSIKNKTIRNFKEDISKVQNKFKFSLPKPFSSLRIKDLTISQMYEKFSQDKNFGLKCTEFLP